MSRLARKLKEMADGEGDGSSGERGVLVQAMLEHGGDPWDGTALAQDPSLKAAEQLWLSYVSAFHPRGEKRCAALQWLLFHLARALQAAAKRQHRDAQGLRGSLRAARTELQALRCDHSLLREQAGQLRRLRELLRDEAPENARLRGRVQCLSSLLALGRKAAPVRPASWHPELRDEASGSLGVREESAGAAGAGKEKLAGEGEQGAGDASDKARTWRKGPEGWPVWVSRVWSLQQCTALTHEEAKRAVASIELPWATGGDIVRALPAGGEILRLVIRRLGEYEPLKDNMEGAPWRDAWEASAYVCGNVLLRVLKQREEPLTAGLDIFGVTVEQGDVGVLACRAPGPHKGFFVGLGSTLIGRPLGECMAALENMGTLMGTEDKGMARKDRTGIKGRKYIPRGTVRRFLISQGFE